MEAGSLPDRPARPQVRARVNDKWQCYCNVAEFYLEFKVLMSFYITSWAAVLLRQTGVRCVNFTGNAVKLCRLGEFCKRFHGFEKQRLPAAYVRITPTAATKSMAKVINKDFCTAAR